MADMGDALDREVTNNLVTSLRKRIRAKIDKSKKYDRQRRLYLAICITGPGLRISLALDTVRAVFTNLEGKWATVKEFDGICAFWDYKNACWLK